MAEARLTPRIRVGQVRECPGSNWAPEVYVIVGRTRAMSGRWVWRLLFLETLSETTWDSDWVGRDELIAEGP